MTLLLAILACSGADTGDTTGDTVDDTGTETCPGPELEDFSAQYAEIYCGWLQACPNPPDLNWAKCEVLYVAMWQGFNENYQACHAQECLDFLASDLPTCSDNGGEWLEIAACKTGYVSPPPQD